MGILISMSTIIFINIIKYVYNYWMSWLLTWAAYNIHAGPAEVAPTFADHGISWIFSPAHCNKLDYCHIIGTSCKWMGSGKRGPYLSRGTILLTACLLSKIRSKFHRLQYPMNLHRCEVHIYFSQRFPHEYPIFEPCYPNLIRVYTIHNEHQKIKAGTMHWTYLQ